MMPRPGIQVHACDKPDHMTPAPRLQEYRHRGIEHDFCDTPSR